MKEVILIPAYEPDERLVELVERLAAEDLGILVVNDGSSARCASVFDAVSKLAVVLHAEKNRGKGAALKLGMTALQEKFPEATHFITADADGQHTVADILRVRKELQDGSEFVLTMRNLRRNIPFRSKIGNDLSRFIYTLLTGHFFRDNQSGLRGFHVKHIDWLLQVKGEKYDYEMNALYHADKQHISITTIPIDTIYIDGNSSSHFDPIRDTLRIYRRLFASATGSLVAVALAEILVLLASLLLGYERLRFSLPSAGAVALAVHLLVDRFIIFRHVRYRDSLRLTVQTVIRFALYTLSCKLLGYMLPWMSLWLSFNVVFVLYIPLEYWARKLLYISQYRVYTKEN